MKETVNREMIIRVITGEANASEEELVGKWLKDHPHHREQFGHYLEIWRSSGRLYDNYDFDRAAARRKIAEKITAHHRRTRVLKARYRIAAAASVILLLGLTLLYLRNHPGPGFPLAEYRTGENEVMEVVLPDSSHIWLNENSSLTVAGNFLKRQRKTELNGEAFFEVKHNPERPFIVRSGQTITQVLGTAFHLRKAANEGVILNVTQGRVAFYVKNRLKKDSEFIAGEKGIYHAEEQFIIRGRIDDPNHLSWKTGVLTFRDSPLDEVCRILSRHFNRPVLMQDQDTSLSLTGTFRNESLEQIISTITLTLDIRASIHDDGVILHQ